MTMHSRVLQAEKRIRPFIRETFLESSPVLSRQCDSKVYLKLDNLQLTGSFKLRGAFNKLLSLSDREAAFGVVTASTGNHGLAVAHALRTTGRQGVIYLPESASPSKVELLRSYEIPLVLHGNACEEAELEARRVAGEKGQAYISPYNDPEVVAGQGTLAVELERQLPDMDAVLVSVGGGGLIAGIGSFLKEVNPGLRLVGCLPENSPVMYECVKAGRILDFPCLPTLSDGTAGGLEPGSITFDMCRDLVDDWHLVSEQEIQAAMKLMIVHHHMIVEGSAAVSVAALLKNSEHYKGLNLAVVICGGNVDADTVRRILNTEP